MKQRQTSLETKLVGVSIVICCHNSASRVAETLRCLAEQKVPESLSWEVILVDNGSTDDTVKVAQASWPYPPPAPLRIVSEPRLGQSNTRICGLDSASYELVSFVDDDNRVAGNWIERVSNRMTSDPAIGACGARVIADFESAPPAWWDEFAGCFAVGDQWLQEGDVTQTKGWLYGAGLTIRKSAWNQLRADGFRFLTSGRRGKALGAGDDNELCYALRLAGWKLWLDWSMQIRHFMPQGRITWTYVRRLYRGAGGTSLVLCGYDAKPPTGWKDRLRMHWWWQALATIKQLLLHPADYYDYAISRREGGHAVLRTESRLGRLAELLRLRGQYRTMLIEIQGARWRRQAPVAAKTDAIPAPH